MPQIITVGEILVEVMRKKMGTTFEEVGEFIGPFPSGAPAIFVDAASKLGAEAGIIGYVGRDEFGKLVLNRLKEDGVDINEVKKRKKYTTGVAFVTYFPDGSRKFIYHLKDSAAGTLKAKDVDEDYFEGVEVLHISGSALTINEKMREACYKAVKIAQKKNALISFDPNVRVELEGIERTKKIFSPVLGSADILSPSTDEIRNLTGEKSIEKAVEKLLKEGAKIIAVKKGKKGCEIFTSSSSSFCAPSIDVEEIDPTGAGDAFSAAIVVGWLENMDVQKLAIFANAVGGMAVTKKGPMEGIVGREDIERVIEEKVT